MVLEFYDDSNSSYKIGEEKKYLHNNLNHINMWLKSFQWHHEWHIYLAIFALRINRNSASNLPLYSGPNLN